MELFPGINIAMILALSVYVLGIVEWFKTPKMITWVVRLISLGISFALVALVMLLTLMTWQIFVVSSVLVFLGANGIWHAENAIGVAIAKNK